MIKHAHRPPIGLEWGSLIARDRIDDAIMQVNYVARIDGVTVVDAEPVALHG